MTTTYGSFPGVRIDVAGGGITAVAIGDEEKLVLFGSSLYQNDGSFPSDDAEDPLDSSLSGSTETATQINARREADAFFGDGSELADGMREALANGANINFLYGVAPKRFNAVDETKTAQDSGADSALDHAPIWEDDVDDEANISNLTVTDTTDGAMDVFYTYRSGTDLTNNPPSATDTILVNPLTGEYAADAAPAGDYEFDYKYLDWQSAFEASGVTGTVNEDETGIYDALTDADSVSSDLDGEASTRRGAFQLVNALSGAEPNYEETITSDGEPLQSDYSNYQRRDARYDTDGSDVTAFSQGSVDSDHYFKFAPIRESDQAKTVLGAVGGLFAGNPLSNPIYNDSITGFDSVEQSFTKTDADNMRDENVIPIRQNGTVRVKDNTSTSTETDWERDFWRRRIADRVILIGKTIGDQIIGRINDEDTRNSAERLIRAELRELVDDRLLKPNTSDSTNWFVDVYVDSTNPDEVNIDIGFTPFGIVKRVDETVTINTS